MTLTDELDQLNLSDHSLFDLCDEVESHLVGSIERLLQSHIANHARSEEKGFKSITTSRFSFDSRLYDIHVAEDVADPANLSVAVVPIKHTSRRQRGSLGRALHVSLGGKGRYARLSLRTDPVFEPLRDELGGSAQQVFSEGYRWLEAHVRHMLLQIEHSVCTDLYLELRATFPEEMVSRIGLYALTKGAALYLLDPEIVEDFLDRASARELSLRESPLELAVALATWTLRADQTISDTAIQTGATIETLIANMAYADTGFDLFEITFYGTDVDIVQPLVRDKRVSLVACYPRQWRSEIEPELEKKKAKFAEILRSQAASVERRLLGMPQRQKGRRWSAGMVAELLGRAAGGFADAVAT